MKIKAKYRLFRYNMADKNEYRLWIMEQKYPRAARLLTRLSNATRTRLHELKLKYSPRQPCIFCTMPFFTVTPWREYYCSELCRESDNEYQHYSFTRKQNSRGK